MKRNFLFALTAAAALTGLGSVAYAEPAIVVDAAPPSAVHEYVPAARSGFVWAPGFYAFEDGHYAWRAGHWMRERPGYVWREARWQQRPDGSWVMIGGTWVREHYGYGYGRDRERDHDRWSYNRDRDNDRWGAYGDRDDDGVPNYRDDHPNDPDRS